MKRNLSVLFIMVSVFALCFAMAANADTFDQVLARWTKSRKYIDNWDKMSNLEVRATYYSAEFIEALMQKEAKDNLWTAQEADEYKYNFLKALRLEEMIPIQVEFVNNGPTMHLGPFDIMAYLYIGNKRYKMSDYDKRFNFKFQGKRDGLIYFPRFDEKTGKDLLKDAKQVRLVFLQTISPITDGKNTTFVWDIANDNPQKLYQGKSAARFETERLLKRLEKLRKDEAELQKQLKSVQDEKQTIQTRLDELAKQ